MLKGKAHKLPDNVDTDVIIPARHCTSFHREELGLHCMEDLDSEFVNKVSKGDFIVAGVNFGCGSSRENAPLAIQGAGISCVIAKSFARIFFRNSINIGLPVLEAPRAAEEARDGDELVVDLEKGVIQNESLRKTYEATAFPPMIQEIIDAGGMVEFVRAKGKNPGGRCGKN
ncbi:MAG: 3-isopropylmalate dehydratase [Latescibacteria bacterium DG_63]|nr:MAG: 3-isopropylmalate dehydratase [Latescibacteria bacterium DG_63]